MDRSRLTAVQLALVSLVLPLAAQAPPLEEDCAPATELVLAATFDGQPITLAELDLLVAGPIEQLRSQLREERERQLELEINSRLLQREAARRGTTALELLRVEVIERVQAPSEADARAFYEEHAEELPGGFAAHRERIVQHLGRERESSAAAAFAASVRARTTLEDLRTGVALGEPALDPATRLASIGEETIDLRAVDAPILPLPTLVAEQIHDLRRRALDAVIADRLVAAEAQRQGITIETLVDREVPVPAIGDDQARAFWDEHGAELGLELDVDDPQDRARVVAYLRQRAEYEGRRALVERLRAAADVEVMLAAPHAADERLLAGDQPSRGAADAPVRVVAFLDFECSNCAGVHEVLTNLPDDLAGATRVTLRDFPLSMHEHALGAALAAEAAREQGAYWDYAALLFARQPALAPADLERYAAELGLDLGRFREALQSKRHAAHVERDREDGRAIGVYSTPTVYVDGRRVSERTREGLEHALREALREHRERSRG